MLVDGQELTVGVLCPDSLVVHQGGIGGILLDIHSHTSHSQIHLDFIVKHCHHLLLDFILHLLVNIHLYLLDPSLQFVDALIVFLGEYGIQVRDSLFGFAFSSVERDVLEPKGDTGEDVHGLPEIDIIHPRLMHLGILGDISELRIQLDILSFQLLQRLLVDIPELFQLNHEVGEDAELVGLYVHLDIRDHPFDTESFSSGL